MMSVMFERKEIEAITGKVKFKAQVRQLQDWGIYLRVRGDGSPVVLREHFTVVKKDDAPKVRLDFS